MADLFKACSNVTWIQGDMGDLYTGLVAPSTEWQEKMCAYGATKDEAIEALDEKVDDACPWWRTAFGLTNLRQGEVQVTSGKFTIDHESWFNNVFKFFS